MARGTGSGGGVLEPDALLAALEQRFLTQADPRRLTGLHCSRRCRQFAEVVVEAGLVHGKLNEELIAG